MRNITLTAPIVHSAVTDQIQIHSDDTRALNCDGCGTQWKCATCIGIRPATYEDLISDVGKELTWYCDTCRATLPGTDNGDKLLKIIQILEHISGRITVAEADLAELKQVKEKENVNSQCIDEKTKKTESKVDTTYNEMVHKIDSSNKTVEKIIEKTKIDMDKVYVCVKDALELQKQEESEEIKDKQNRKTSIIVQVRHT